jgi:hypothetical protein
MALQLDSATNNTSLVIAIELADGAVLIFAADAQWGTGSRGWGNMPLSELVTKLAEKT